MKQPLIIITKFLVAVCLLFAGLFGYGYYQELPARLFCESIPGDSTPSEVVKTANEQGLPVFDTLENNSKIIVLNHKSPMFRVACQVEFKESHITSKGIIGAD